MDAVARVLSTRFSETLRQQFIVDNRPGAAGTMGADLVAKAVPDGHTLLIDGTPITITAHFQKQPRFDPIRDFTPISLLASAPNVMVVTAGFSAKTVKETIAAAVAQPGKLSYGSGGNGTITHLTGELFRLTAKINIVHVPYKSIANATTDVIGGQIPLAFPVMPGVVPHIRSGRLRALGMTSAQRSSALPEVPTFEELGMAGLIVGNWFGFLGPGGLPGPIAQRLNQSAVEAMRSTESQARFGALGFDIIASTPTAFAKQLQSDVVKWARVVKAAGITSE